MKVECQHTCRIGYPTSYPAAGYEHGPHRWTCSHCGKEVPPFEQSPDVMRYIHLVWPEIMEELIP